MLIMTNRPRPQSPHTPQAEQLLVVLRTNGGWMRRSDIADAMHKKRLNKWDTALLDLLTENGLIEADKRNDPNTPIGYTWFYRATTD